MTCTVFFTDCTEYVILLTFFCWNSWKLQFCQWGSQLVPCAPGYGGAWVDDHTQDAGIWGTVNLPTKPRVREHVKAGRRSKPYLSDMFTYGSAGIFGAHAGRDKSMYKVIH